MEKWKDWSNAYSLKAEVYLHQKDTVQAEKWLDKSLQLMPFFHKNRFHDTAHQRGNIPHRLCTQYERSFRFKDFFFFCFSGLFPTFLSVLFKEVPEIPFPDLMRFCTNFLYYYILVTLIYAKKCFLTHNYLKFLFNSYLCPFQTSIFHFSSGKSLIHD